MKYGFLGAGNMASAIIRGMVKFGIDAKEIGVFNRSLGKSIALEEECGVVVCNSRTEILDAEVVIIAVKPQVLDTIIKDIKKELEEKTPLIISLAAGKTFDYFDKNLGENHKITRVMPNINAKVLMSTTAYCSNGNVSDKENEIVETIFGAIGSITEIDEKMMSIFGAIAGSSPAFTYLYIDTIARAAQKAGMPKAQALEIAASSVLGSAKMVLESNTHPTELSDQVCSPGGTTIEGVLTLKELGFENSVLKAVEATLNKDFLIQQKK